MEDTAGAVSFYVDRNGGQHGRGRTGQTTTGDGAEVEKEKLMWLQEMIRKNNLHGFYSSAEWQRLAATAREQQHNECQRCREMGCYSPCAAVHHIRRVKKYPELALSIENLECLCRACHEEEHRQGPHIYRKAQQQGQEPWQGAYTNEERW